MLEMHNWLKSEQEQRVNLSEDVKHKLEMRAKIEVEQNNDSKYSIILHIDLTYKMLIKNLNY